MPQLLAFGASEVYAADRVRCSQTVEPLARAMDVPIALEPSLTEEAYAADPKAARRRILEIAALGGTPVICTQGKVIPYVIDWWCARDGVQAGPVAQPQGQYLDPVAGRRPAHCGRPSRQSTGRPIPLPE